MTHFLPSQCRARRNPGSVLCPQCWKLPPEQSCVFSGLCVFLSEDSGPAESTPSTLRHRFLIAISLEIRNSWRETRCAALACRRLLSSEITAGLWFTCRVHQKMHHNSKNVKHLVKPGWLHSTFIRISLKDHCMCCTWTPVCTHIPTHIHKL